jgi:hypothetical protein
VRDAQVDNRMFPSFRERNEVVKVDVIGLNRLAADVTD